MGDFISGGSETDKVAKKPVPAGVSVRNVTRASDLNDIKTALKTGLIPSTYQARTEKGAASGYCPLDASALVPVAQIPPVTATGSTVARSLADRFANVHWAQDFATFAAAVAAANTSGKTLMISTPWTITTAIGTITAPVEFVSTGRLVFTAGSLTINRLETANLGWIFDLSAGGTLLFARGATAQLEASWFGAVGDGVTDSTAAIQKALDVAIASKIELVHLLDGRFRTTDTITLGTGIGTKGVTLRGSGPTFWADNAESGTVILPDATDRAVFQFLVTRNSSIEGMTIFGKNWSYIKTNLNHTLPVLDRTNPALWVDPAILAVSPNADSRYAPYTGILINALTSHTSIKDVDVYGFVVAIGQGLAGDDGNGDFIYLTNVSIDGCKYGISTGSTQCRQVTLVNSSVTNCYTGFTNVTHGLQTGEMDLLCTACNIGTNELLLNITVAYAGCTTFTACNGENMYQLGLVATSGEGTPVVFVNCDFDFVDESSRTVPIERLTGSGGTPDVVFLGGQLSDSRVFTWNSVNVSFRGTLIRPRSDWSFVGTSPVARKIAINGLMGMFPRLASKDWSVGGVLQVVSDNFINVTLTSASGAVAIDMRDPENTRNTYSARWNRNRPFPIWAVKRNILGEDLGLNVIGLDIARGTDNLGAVSQAGIQFSTNISAWSSTKRSQIGAGDAVLDQATGNRFWVVSFDGTTLVLELLNNYFNTGSGYTTTATLATASGTLTFLNSRVFRPAYPTLADITSASAVLTNCGRADTFFGYNEFQANDLLLSATNDMGATGRVRGAFSNPAKVVSSDTGARTITLDKTSNRTETNLPLNFWVRAP